MSIPDSINSNFLASGKQPKGVIVLTVVLFLSFLWAFVAYWAVSSRAEILQGTEQVLRRMDHAVGEQTRRQFAMIGVFLGVADQWITDNPGADPRSDRRFLRLVENFRERTDRAIDIQLASEAGQVFPLLAKAAAPPPALAIGDTDYFRFAMGGDSGRFFIGAPQVSSASGTWGIPVAQRLTHPQKGVAAVVASVELSALLALYEEERIRLTVPSCLCAATVLCWQGRLTTSV